jgi:hypothetical protein
MPTSYYTNTAKGGSTNISSNVFSQIAYDSLVEAANKDYVNDISLTLPRGKKNVQVEIVKNKVSPPFKSCTIDLIYGEGISRYAEILDLGEQMKLLSKTGSWYVYEGDKIGNGREAAKTYLREHPEFADGLEAKIRTFFKPTANPDGVIEE